MNDARPVRLLKPLPLSAAAFLYFINAFVCRALFRVEYTLHWNSIEGAYVALSRYILDHWHDFNWFPLWYGGIPFQNTYPPLLHMLVAADAWIAHVSPARAHHIVAGFFYCLGPAALFLLVYALSGRLGLSLTCGLMFSFTSPSVLLLHQFLPEMESWRGARRLQTLVTYGDGPHITAITLLLFALLFLHLALDRGGAFYAWLAILFYAAVVLTNWLGTFALAMATLCYLLARSSSDRRLLRTLGISAGIGAIAFCLIAPWIPPSTLRDVQRNAQYTIGRFVIGVHQYEVWGLIVLCCPALWWIFTRYRVSLCMQFGAYFLFITAALTMPADWFGFFLMPQPHRYHLELEIAEIVVIVFGLGPLLLRMFGKYKIWLVAVLLSACVVQAVTYRLYAKITLKASELHDALEYQVATWLETHLPNQRVFATGSVQFWMNAFAHNPQVGGGFGQGISNPEIPIIHYGIPFTEGDGERTAMWLRLLGAQAVVTSGPTGRDSYKEAWHDPNKFKGVLPELWRIGGDAIYAVSQRTTSLAHMIHPGDVVGRSPVNVVDDAPVLDLARALEDPSLPSAEFSWRGQGTARITGDWKPDQILFVQESYDPGWNATVNGKPAPISKDGLGFIVIDPRCDGPCDVELSFDGGPEMHHGYELRMLGIFAALAWMFLWLWKR